MEGSNAFKVEDPTPTSKKGFFVSKKLLIIISSAIAAVFVAAILITYFATASSSSSTTTTTLATTTAASLPSTNPPTSQPATTATTSSLSSTNPPVTTTTTQAPINYRLPDNLVPSTYDLTVQPYFKVTTEPSNFDGTISINFRCLKSTNRLVMHMRELEINNSSLSITSSTHNGFSKTNFKWTYDSLRNFFIAEFEDSFLANNEYTFSAKFKGLIKNDNNGFYKSSYLDDNNQRRWIVAAQLFAVEARKAFICFDEPALKAKFTIKVIHDSSLHAVSNMPIKNNDKYLVADGYDWEITEFVETEKMSTYLLSLVISDYTSISEYSQPPISNNVSVSIYTRPNVPLEEKKLALEVSVQLLEVLEKFYNTEYPLPKLDHALIPDMRFSGMELWGLIIYRENTLLFKPRAGRTLQQQEQGIYTLITHEIAHMWYGDLVTPKWWDDLWLNEGFASYMEFIGLDVVKPEWRMIDQKLEGFLDVFQADSKDSTRPINMEINSPAEIDSNVDPIITYGKGSAIVSMANYILGESTFRNGITSYFADNKYSNVDQNDLWRYLQLQAIDDGKLTGLNLTTIMNMWTQQKGHPVVTVTKKNATHISVKQHRFVLDPNYPIQNLNDLKWYIPFTHTVENIQSSSSENTQYNSSNIYQEIVWIEPSETEKTIPLKKPLNDENDFILANLDMAAFYRVNYDEQNWKSIIKQLNTDKEKISARMRAYLISDILNFLQAEYLNVELVFDYINYLKTEFDYLPWKIFLNRIGYFNNLLDSSRSSLDFENFLSSLIEPYYNSLGWSDNESQKWNDRLIRKEIVEFACKQNLPDCVDNSKRFFTQWMSNRDTNYIRENYQSVVYCTALRHGSRTEFDYLYNEFKSTNSTSLIPSLTCTQDQSLLNKLLNDQYSTNNIYTVLRNIANKPYTYYLAWNFLRTNWDDLNQRLGSSNIVTLLNDLSNKFSSDFELQEFVSFFENKNLPSIQESIKEIENKIKANNKWINQNSGTLENWLESNIDTKTDVDYRLPENIIPEHYDLEIKPFIGPKHFPLNDTFEGKINMHILCSIPTNKVIFHAKELEINVVGFDQVDNIDDFDTRNKIDANKRIDTDDEREFIIVTLNRECKQGTRYILKLEYSGIIIDKLYGFYRSSYVNAAQQSKYLATTKFQPVDARRAFPCFDEPNLKTSFKISIIREKDMNSYSNNPIIDTEDIPGEVDWEKDLYDTTVKMSSYLAAFVISDFKMIEKNSPIHNINVQVVARPEAIDNGSGDYGLDVTADIIDFFVDYFDVKYPLSKSTQIAIPDFNSGAMENWGLVTYRESSLLYNPNTDTAANKKRVAEVISHELAHQWFGNLVTMDWWNDLWLNEGFASWVQYLGVESVHPEWRNLEYFFVGKTLPVMVKDSYETSHPINVEVKNPREIGSLFDSISYDKGSSIIRMMNSFLTESTFKAGVSNYLKINSFGNAVQDQLWNELTKQGHKDGTLDLTLSIEEIMNNWTKIKGYPVVNVHRVNNKIEVTQEYFLLNPQSQIINDKQEYNKYKWYIPFNFKTKDDQGFDVFQRPTWFKPTDTKLTIDLNAGVSSDSWIIANIEHSGFYRVNYDSQNWELIIEQLKTQFSDFSSITRAQLLDDSFNLGRADKLDQTFFLGIVEYLKSETDPMAFTSAFYGLNYISDMLSTEIFLFNKYKKFYLDLLTPSYIRVGWNETLDDVNEINMQTSILQTVCSLGYKDCIDKARDYYNRIGDSVNPIPNNFKDVVYRTVIKYGTDDDWLSLYERALVTVDQAEKLRFVRALTFTQSYPLLKFILSKSSDTKVVRSQDETTIIADVANNVIGRRLAFDYVDENWDYFFEKYSRVSFTLPNLVTRTFQLLNTRQDLNNLKEFKIRHPVLGIATNAFNEVMEIVNTNTLWTEKNFAIIDEWLS